MNEHESFPIDFLFNLNSVNRIKRISAIELSRLQKKTNLM